MTLCPCGSNTAYEACCGLFINGSATPATPEALMRSRYTAYTQANIEYISKTMKGPAAKDFNAEEAEAWAKQITWLTLQVLYVKQDKTHGWVEFVAQYAYGAKKHNLHEVSEFCLEEGKWYYIDGKTPKIGRNDFCPCGSNKKFKKCCEGKNPN
jgi:SEC-C motif-containing protein